MGRTSRPEWLTCLHEEVSVGMAHGYAKVAGKPMAAIMHGAVGTQHASMAIYNAYCDRRGRPDRHLEVVRRTQWANVRDDPEAQARRLVIDRHRHRPKQGAETPIEDGKFADGLVTFKVTREFNDNKLVFNYEGKLDGDAIKGTTKFTRDGESQSRDWEAKRQAADLLVREWVQFRG